MKNSCSLKLISLSMVLVFAASSASCSHKKREYKTISDSDPWYECSSFEVSELYSEDEYQYCYFETVGTADDSVYVKAEALRRIEGDYRNMSEEDYMRFYEQSILRFSFDGKLLGKTDFDPIAGNGIYKALQKAWIYKGELNILEQVFDTALSGSVYYLNGKALTLPEVGNYYENPVYIEDIFVSDGYILYKLYVNSWAETFALVRPDGSFEEIFLDLEVNYSVNSSGQFIPTDDGKVMLPVYLSTGENIFISIDPVSGEVEELKGLYGTNNYWLEYSSGKIIARDFNGISTVDRMTGELKPVCGYNDIDALLCDVMDSHILYVSDDGSEIILGYESYDRYSISSGYEIMHLTKASKNPNAGKTELLISTDMEFYPERSDFTALQQFNRNNGSYFIRYVLPTYEDGELKEADADIYLTYDPSREPSDKSRYVDLSRYLDLENSSYKDQFFGNAMEAAKDGDGIYRVPLDISAYGIITASSNVPEGQKGFTFTSYTGFVDNVCNGVDPLSKTPGYRMGKAESFTRLFMSMSDIFITDGKVILDNDEMRELMLFVDEYGSDTVMTEEEIYKTAVTEHNEEIQAAIDAMEGKAADARGKSGAKYGELYSFDNYIGFYSMYGSELGIYGLPSFDARGPMTLSHEFVSVSSGSLYPEACADFVKLLLSYDIQKNMNSNPINREALRTVAEERLALYNKEVELENALEPVNSYGYPSSVRIPEDAVEKYIDILSSSYSGTNVGKAVEQILREESSSYFEGGRSLDDVINVMQKRIQTVLDETA